MAIWALAGTLAFSFLLELIGASAANSSGWGIVGAIAAMGAFLIHTIEQAHKKTPEADAKPPVSFYDALWGLLLHFAPPAFSTKLTAPSIFKGCT